MGLNEIPRPQAEMRHPAPYDPGDRLDWWMVMGSMFGGAVVLAGLFIWSNFPAVQNVVASDAAAVQARPSVTTSQDMVFQSDQPAPEPGQDQPTEASDEPDVDGDADQDAEHPALDTPELDLDVLFDEQQEQAEADPDVEDAGTEAPDIPTKTSGEDDEYISAPPLTPLYSSDGDGASNGGGITQAAGGGGGGGGGGGSSASSGGGGGGGGGSGGGGGGGSSGGGSGDVDSADQADDNANYSPGQRGAGVLSGTVYYGTLDLHINAALPKPVFDITRLQNKPDTRSLGMTPATLMMAGALLKTLPDEFLTRATWEAAGRPSLDHNRMTKAVSDVPRDSLLILDIEFWELFQHDDLAEVDYALDRFIEIVTVIREARPDLKIGYFGRLPRVTYVAAARGPGHESYDGIVERIAYTQRLADVVDVIIPPCFRVGDDERRDLQDEFNETSVELARLYGKPVLPYMMNRYRPRGRGEEQFEMVPPNEWRQDLEQLYEIGDGVIICSFDADKDWNPAEMPWLQETIDVLGEKQRQAFATFD